ncbi:GNAT family N-acetyltransferase [Rossellomorea vietnamensis]|uniref:GNAT family N-acetyltransferase n=1 Tax=Rossellomorea vietnamensis TaxID=218284 RepID=UPI00077C95B0|nr:GNAT family N-acetyltransferase [Rossellomorea vietnamensis]OXS63729.1 GNAT family N-acetyltransferase [Bacillus sp. DSM 27956]PRX78796.1 acetyltransferase (GNAT) family protein [Bacillus sp. V-88]SLK12861.1 Acetyltransferase (GNAT) family protein [Bacillus sp. V-88]
MKIIELHKDSSMFEQAVNVFWGQWGNEDNYRFYHDCMFHSCGTEADLPRFYIVVREGDIIGTYALLRNDLNSRQDLFPWFACLYVHPDQRGEGLGSTLLDHALREAHKKGYDSLYLTTDLEGYYEKYGWTHSTEAIGLSGDSMKVYQKGTSI